MNDPIKYLITGAAIAIVCGAAGTMGGVWLMKEMGNSGQRTEVRGQKSGISIQSPVTSGQSSVFSGQRMSQNPVITIPSRSGGSNVAFRATPSAGKMPMNYNQFQKVQELPEVKAARDAFMDAQKKYSEAMKKAVESGQGTVASASKSTPLTIQVPPARSGTNGTVQVKGK
ncbi:MAG: hypothetical protein WCV00_15260 [Verrucomicrobiia bacterium]|jgi:hypothetical protein